MILFRRDYQFRRVYSCSSTALFCFCSMLLFYPRVKLAKLHALVCRQRATVNYLVSNFDNCLITTYRMSGKTADWYWNIFCTPISDGLTIFCLFYLLSILIFAWILTLMTNGVVALKIIQVSKTNEKAIPRVIYLLLLQSRSDQSFWNYVVHDELVLLRVYINVVLTAVRALSSPSHSLSSTSGSSEPASSTSAICNTSVIIK